MTAQIEPMVSFDELRKVLGGLHPDTIRVKIKAGKLPPPDWQASQRLRMWRRQTLIAWGLLPQTAAAAPTATQA